ncbi:MAG: hypothetical protein K6T65_13050 [Peptococcaceae bacterium]|nr:hypothetical protein [Peptococcaceae bacterium]
MTGKICPLLAIAAHVKPEGDPQPDSSCHGECCAWWNPHDEECAVLTLGRAFCKHYLVIEKK